MGRQPVHPIQDQNQEDRTLKRVTDTIINDCLFFAEVWHGKYSTEDVLRKAKEAIEAQLKANETKAEEHEAGKAMKKSKRQKLAPVGTIERLQFPSCIPVLIERR
jgi:hypothetical protein